MQGRSFAKKPGLLVVNEEVVLSHTCIFLGMVVGRLFRDQPGVCTYTYRISDCWVHITEVYICSLTQVLFVHPGIIGI